MSQDFGDGFAVLESGPGSAVTDAMASWFVEKLFEVTTAAERRWGLAGWLGTEASSAQACPMLVFRWPATVLTVSQRMIVIIS